MARFEDYVKAQNEAIEEEIIEASEAQEERVRIEGVPDSVLNRFDGKDQAEVLRSYAELERAYSQQGNTMGELRKSFDEYVNLQSQTSEPEQVYEPVTADEMYEDPENAVARVVQKHTGDKLKELEEELNKAKMERKISEFDRKFPDAKQIAHSPEFAEWVQGSPFRQRLAQQADSYDFEAAEELFGLYNDSTQTVAASQEATKRDQQLREATLESASPESAKLDETFSRADIIQAKLSAKYGNAEAQTWLRKNGEAIAIAYEEGRVVD
jgi:hypothetical protein